MGIHEHLQPVHVVVAVLLMVAERQSRIRRNFSAGTHRQAGRGLDEPSVLIRDIEAMAEPLGRRLYRGLLKTVARVWNPTEIREAVVLRKVLKHMQAAERGLRRLDAALNRVEPGTVVAILRALQLNSLDQVDCLESLKKVVLEVERVAEITL